MAMGCCAMAVISAVSESVGTSVNLEMVMPDAVQVLALQVPSFAVYAYEASVQMPLFLMMYSKP